MTDVPTVPTLTAQEAFDRVARHLLTMPHQSYDDGFCSYRAPDGNRCAVGCLIPDDAYVPDLEGVSIGSLVGFPKFAPWKSIVNLLCKLQCVHDDKKYWHEPFGRTEMRQQLKIIASDFDLSPHVLDEMESAP